MANETPKKRDQAASRTADHGAGQLQERFDKEAEQGYRGVVADPTPNSAYTVSGVTSGEPTPETDKDAARAATARKGEIEDQLAEVHPKETK